MFGEVRLATHRLTGVRVAVKVMGRIGMSETAVNAEIRAMKLVKGHPHVVQLFEVRGVVVEILAALK